MFWTAVCQKSHTGYGRVKSEGLQAGELFAPGLLHAVPEDVLPGVQLQQLDAPQQLVGLLQTLTGIFLEECKLNRESYTSRIPSVHESNTRAAAGLMTWAEEPRSLFGSFYKDPSKLSSLNGKVFKQSVWGDDRTGENVKKMHEQHLNTSLQRINSWCQYYRCIVNYFKGKPFNNSLCRW